jgi:preprotein translocase subunit SecE
LSTNPARWAEQTREYLNEVESEFKKVTWPTQQETIAGTVSVMVVVAVIAIALGGVDYTLSWIMSWLLP